MKKYTSAIVFDHRGRVNDNTSPASVEIRVTIGRVSYYVAAPVKVCRREFKHGIIVNRPDSRSLNGIVQLMLDRVDLYFSRLEEDAEFDVQDLKAFLGVKCRTPKSSAVKTENVRDCDMLFPDWYEKQLPSLRIKYGTLKHYKCTLARLRACNYIIRWSDVNVESIYRFDSFLRSFRSQKGTMVGDGCVHGHHKNLKAMLNRALRMGLILQNPYSRLRGEFPRGDIETVEFLTEREMEAFAQYVPNGRMEKKARDLFIFMAYTGMAYSDAQAFNIENYEEEDGRWFGRSSRIKTGVKFTTMLLPPAVEVIKQYDMKVPVISNQKFNETLKAIASKIGIKKKLTTHVARHTFATWALHHGVSIEIVGKMLGQSSVRITQRYAKVLDEDVRSRFQSLERIITIGRKKKTSRPAK